MEIQSDKQQYLLPSGKPDLKQIQTATRKIAVKCGKICFKVQTAWLNRFMEQHSYLFPACATEPRVVQNFVNIEMEEDNGDNSVCNKDKIAFFKDKYHVL